MLLQCKDTMKGFNRLVAIFCALLMGFNGFHFSKNENSLQAADYVYDAGGCGYQQCRKAPCIAPAIALGTIALVAIIAVAIQNQGDNSHGHCHSSSSSGSCGGSSSSSGSSSSLSGS